MDAGAPYRIPHSRKTRIQDHSQAIPAPYRLLGLQRTLLGAYRYPDLSFRLPKWCRAGINAEAERSSVAPEAGRPGPEDEEEGEEQPAGLLGEREDTRRHGRFVGREVVILI